MPKINKKYYRHLIRGIFDGDGSVYINTTTTSHNGISKKYKYLNASFTSGSKVLVKQIQDILKNEGIESNIVKDSRVDVFTWYLKIYRNDSVKKFYKYMYNNSKIYLLRKKEKFEIMI